MYALQVVLAGSLTDGHAVSAFVIETEVRAYATGNYSICRASILGRQYFAARTPIFAECHRAIELAFLAAGTGKYDHQRHRIVTEAAGVDTHGEVDVIIVLYVVDINIKLLGRKTVPHIALKQALLVEHRLMAAGDEKQ